MLTGFTLSAYHKPNQLDLNPTEQIQLSCERSMPSFPVFWPHDRADRSYNNLLSKQGSFPRMLRTSKYFKLPNLSASRSCFCIPRAVETERYSFSRETNHHAIICCTYKTGHYCVHQVSSLSPLPIRLLFYCFLLVFALWPTPLSPILLLPALRRSTTMTLGTTRRRRVPRW
jgi:hypothetical protein